MSRVSAKDPSALVSMYRSAAAAHGDATEIGDSKLANRQARIILQALDELRKRGLEERLIVLLRDEHSWVRCWAGTHMIDSCPEIAQPVLIALEAGPKGLVRLNAEMALSQWRERMRKHSTE